MIVMCILLLWRALLLDWEVEAEKAVRRSASMSAVADKGVQNESEVERMLDSDE